MQCHGSLAELFAWENKVPLGVWRDLDYPKEGCGSQGAVCSPGLKGGRSGAECRCWQACLSLCPRMGLLTMRRISTAFPPSPFLPASAPSSVGSGKRSACPTKGNCWELLVSSVGFVGLPAGLGENLEWEQSGKADWELCGGCRSAWGWWGSLWS